MNRTIFLRIRSQISVEMGFGFRSNRLLLNYKYSEDLLKISNLNYLLKVDHICC